LSETERATEQRLREIERARAEQFDIARSWILLFTLAATFGLWWVFYNRLKLDFYVSWLLSFVVALVLRRILSFYVGMRLGKKYARQLKDQLLGR
jgi:membrane protein implicated in regulation of membrane protease activity